MNIAYPVYRFPVLVAGLSFLFFMLGPKGHAQNGRWLLLETNCRNFGEAVALQRQLTAEKQWVAIISKPEEILVFSDRAVYDLKRTFPAIKGTASGDSDLSSFYLALTSGQLSKISNDYTPAAGTTCVQHALEPRNDPQVYPPPIPDLNSETARGVVVASALFIESDGSRDKNYYSWTQKALDQEKQTILRALTVWSYTAAQYGEALTFIPDWNYRKPEMDQGLEPNIRFGSFDFYTGDLIDMSQTVLRKSLNKSEQDYFFSLGHQWNDFQKRLHQADGAFTMAVHYSHQGRGYIRAQAFIGGPVTFLAGGTGFEVYGHEIGHIFHALDEYNNPNCDAPTWGFNGVPNANNISNGCRGKQLCLMNDNRVLGNDDKMYYALCSYSLGHLGWDEPYLPTPLKPVWPPQGHISGANFLTFKAISSDPKAPTAGLVRLFTKDQNGLDSLIEEIATYEPMDSIRLANTRPLYPGQYYYQFMAGLKGQYAMIPSEAVAFEIDPDQWTPLQDTCIYACQTFEPFTLPGDGWNWYADPLREKILQSGSTFTPDPQQYQQIVYATQTGSENIIKTFRKFEFILSQPLSFTLHAEPTGDSIFLYPQSFLPLIGTFMWYRNDTLIAESDQKSGISVRQPGKYQMCLQNGCHSCSIPLNVIRPPVYSYFPNCSDNSYTLIGRGDSLQWMQEDGTLIDTRDTLVRKAGDFLFLSQIVDGQESPRIGIWLPELTKPEIEIYYKGNIISIQTTHFPVDIYRNDTLILQGDYKEYTPTKSGSYTVHAVDRSGCKGISNTLEINIPLAPPVPEQSVYTICEIGKDPFENLPIIEVAGENLRWYYDGDLNELMNIGNRYKVTYLDIKNRVQYFITQTVDGITSPPAKVRLEIAQPLQIVVDSFGNELHAIANGLTELDPADYQYEWGRNGLLLPEITGSILYPQVTAWYSSRIANLDNTCQAVDSLFWEGLPTAVEPDPEEINFVVYPNPAKDQLYWKSDAPVLQIQIYTLDGRLIQQLKNAQQSGQILPPASITGMYILKAVFTDGKIAVRKIIWQE